MYPTTSGRVLAAFCESLPPLPIRLMIRRVPRSRCLGLNPSGSAVCHDASSVRRYPPSARAVRSAKAGCPAIFARKHAAATAIDALDEACPASCTSARQAATAASWSCAACELCVEPPERPGVGSPRVRADGGLHQAPRGAGRRQRQRPVGPLPCPYRVHRTVTWTSGRLDVGTTVWTSGRLDVWTSGRQRASVRPARQRLRPARNRPASTTTGSQTAAVAHHASRRYAVSSRINASTVPAGSATLNGKQAISRSPPSTNRKTSVSRNAFVLGYTSITRRQP